MQLRPQNTRTFSHRVRLSIIVKAYWVNFNVCERLEHAYPNQLLMSFLQLSSISAVIANRLVLKDISLCLERDEAVAILGPSGSGKSTLLRTIAGLLQPTGGRVLLHGKAINTYSPAQRGIALLTQDYALYPQLTVQQNILATLSHLPHDQRSDRCKQVAAWFSIEDLLDRYSSQISGGQAQRVAFAKAVAKQPQLLLLDEPLSQLDIVLRRQVIEGLLTARQQLQCAVLWVTHDPREAAQVGSRLIVLNEGQLVHDANARDTYCRPSSRLVADMCSLWPISWICCHSIQSHIALNDYRPESASWVGLRAEHLNLQPAQSGQLGFDVEIVRTESLGFAYLIHAKSPQIGLSILTPAEPPQPGTRIAASIDPKHLIWL